jgi:hypothetical protein
MRNLIFRNIISDADNADRDKRTSLLRHMLMEQTTIAIFTLSRWGTTTMNPR